VKAIYTRFGKKVYRINQDMHEPTNTVFGPSGIHVSINEDTANKRVVQNININTLKRPGVKSNAQLYNELVEYLKEEEITEIDSLQDFYKVCIDYSIFENGKEIDRAQVIRPIKSEDKILILGVATNSECVYRRVKTFKPEIDFKIKEIVPYGIMKTRNENYIVKINDIGIYESKREYREVHKSQYEVAYDSETTVVPANFEDFVLIYSLSQSGAEIAPVSLNYIPRIMEIVLDIVLTNYIVAYNDNDIFKILQENTEKKYHPVTPDDGVESPEVGEDDILIPDEDNKPIADGEYEPDEDGYYSWYERCNETTPNSLLVVEDAIADSVYNVDTMIKKSMVIADVEDIEVGEYVLYREAIDEPRLAGH